MPIHPLTRTHLQQLRIRKQGSFLCLCPIVFPAVDRSQDRTVRAAFELPMPNGGDRQAPRGVQVTVLQPKTRPLPCHQWLAEARATIAYWQDILYETTSRRDGQDDVVS